MQNDMGKNSGYLAMNWPFKSFTRHLIEENEWLRAQHRLLQAKLDRLEAAVWAQQSPSGAAYANSTLKHELPIAMPTESSWEQYEKNFYEDQCKEETAT